MTWAWKGFAGHGSGSADARRRLQLRLTARSLAVMSARRTVLQLGQKSHPSQVVIALVLLTKSSCWPPCSVGSLPQALGPLLRETFAGADCVLGIADLK